MKTMAPLTRCQRQLLRPSQFSIRNTSSSSSTTIDQPTSSSLDSLSHLTGPSSFICAENQVTPPPHDEKTQKKIRMTSFIQRMENNARKTIELRQRLAIDRDRLSKIGSIQDTLLVAKPSHFRTHPTPISDLTLATLITATTHLGHNTSLTCPTNYPLIYGTRSDIAVIDLQQTLTYLRRACNVIRETVKNDGMILFANGIPGTEKAIKQASERLGSNGYSLGIRPNGKGATWVRGTLTNATEVLKRSRLLAKQLRLSNSNQNSQDRHSQRRQQSENLESLKFLPSLIVLFSPRDSRILIREAALKQIPTIGVIDTDIDPRIVTYPIPANDDSIRSIELIAGVLSKAGQDGLEKRKERISAEF